MCFLTVIAAVLSAPLLYCGCHGDLHRVAISGAISSVHLLSAWFPGVDSFLLFSHIVWLVPWHSFTFLFSHGNGWIPGSVIFL